MSRALLLFVLFLGLRLTAAEVMPPKPDRYFNDYAQVVSPETAAQLNARLEAFEKESSAQIVVAVFPRMQSDSSIEDYTVRVARFWEAGQKDKNNGAVLFVFIQDRKLYVQVGYGLEGVLPDALCQRIIAEQITPRFKGGDYNGGLTAGVDSLLAAVKGEYRGTGTTVAEQNGRRQKNVPLIFVLLIGLPLLFVFSRAGRHQRGRGGGWIITSGGGGSWSGGGWGGGGGGGFSGGGGSFGGGGSGGSW